MKLKQNELKEFLDFKVNQYNTKAFITDDPIQIPHQFRLKEDIEISGFLVSTIAWGNRKSIIKSGGKMIELMGESPYDFVMTASPKQIKRLEGFVHRTFNGADFATFIKAIRNLYKKHGGFENVFAKCATPDSLQPAIHEFKKIFFTIECYGAEMIEKKTYDIWEKAESKISHKNMTLKEWEKKLNTVWVLKSEHEALVKRLTKEILDLSYEAYITKKKLTELKGGVQK
jgi:uncharacterized protein (TIGR02757 family)